MAMLHTHFAPYRGQGNGQMCLEVPHPGHLKNESPGIRSHFQEMWASDSELLQCVVLFMYSDSGAYTAALPQPWQWRTINVCKLVLGRCCVCAKFSPSLPQFCPFSPLKSLVPALFATGCWYTVHRNKLVTSQGISGLLISCTNYGWDPCSYKRKTLKNPFLYTYVYVCVWVYIHTRVRTHTCLCRQYICSTETVCCRSCKYTFIQLSSHCSLVV